MNTSLKVAIGSAGVWLITMLMGAAIVATTELGALNREMPGLVTLGFIGQLSGIIAIVAIVWFFVEKLTANRLGHTTVHGDYIAADGGSIIAARNAHVERAVTTGVSTEFTIENSEIATSLQDVCDFVQSLRMSDAARERASSLLADISDMVSGEKKKDRKKGNGAVSELVKLIGDTGAATTKIAAAIAAIKTFFS